MGEWLAENTGLVTAWTAIVISVFALVVTLWQAYVMRRHNKLSVRPLLVTAEQEKTNGNTGYFLFELENCGVGPAIIKNFILLDGDKEIARNNRKAYNDFLTKIIKDNAKTSNLTISSLAPGGALPAGAKHLLLEVTYDIKNSNTSFTHQLNLTVEYQSIYEDKDKTFVCDTRNFRIFSGMEAQNG